MKIYLASFLEPENFGPGEIISVSYGNKPRNVKVNSIFKPLAPSPELMEEYNKLRPVDPGKASEFFISSYQNQLESFIAEVNEEAQKNNISPIEVLPFKDGDTLASWERKNFTNFRMILAGFLEKLSYEVVLN